MIIQKALASWPSEIAVAVVATAAAAADASQVLGVEQLLKNGVLGVMVAILFYQAWKRETWLRDDVKKREDAKDTIIAEKDSRISALEETRHTDLKELIGKHVAVTERQAALQEKTVHTLEQLSNSLSQFVSNRPCLLAGDSDGVTKTIHSITHKNE